MDRIEQDSPADLRRKLGKRLALAAVLILVLLGALAVFDYVSELEREEASRPVAAVQPRVGGSISSPRPNAPADQQITPPASLEPKELPAGAEPPPKPEIAAQPAAAPTAPATTTAAAPSAASPAVPPAAVPAVPPVAGAPAVAKPLAPVAPKPIAVAPSPAATKAPVGAVSPAVPAAAVTPGPQATAPSVAGVPEETSGAPLVGAPPSARLPQPAASAASAAATNQSVLARLAAGFVLQAGVFTSTERAEELRAKLVMAGVPVVVESRVQVGPFASQKEAAAARRKIRELGVDSIIIPPRGGRR